MEFLDAVFTTLAYLLCTLLLFAVGKWIYGIFNPKIQVSKELVEKDNLAFAFAHVGYYTGLVLTIGGTILGLSSHGLIVDLIAISVYGLLGIVLLNVSIILNDRIIFSKFEIYDEVIRDKNIGTGIIEGSNAVATGLILMGAIYGEGGGITTTLVFWALGQMMLILTGWIYNVITPYDIHHEIEEKNNIAVGVGFSGAIIALGNLIREGLMIDFESWWVTLFNVGSDVVIGLTLLPLARWAADRLLLPGKNLTDEVIHQKKPNIGAAIIEALAYISGSVLISLSI